ncbi:YqaE/Pmp3 family membrane protein [Halomonas halocynthiae]|uniref:YqaE/Pmp3 family membrane protein n=1 Tax=Halomonas halocynthiae TaxID=176290 RepID=UPI000419F9AE|nr:YqaE/Pmp3 family membrane protein [Halomonas halocynthiae]
MDAREYLAQKGLDGKPRTQPQLTLEEKSWARAKASGKHRPRAGTPHDWEDWERYHEQLADAAEQLEQKIAPDETPAPTDNEVNSKRAPSAKQYSVEHYVPEASISVPTKPVGKPSLHPFAAYVALSVLLPPLAVWLSDGGAKRGVVALLLMLAGWLPGVAYALYWVVQQRDQESPCR